MKIAATGNSREEPEDENRRGELQNLFIGAKAYLHGRDCPFFRDRVDF
jgi:hypothetical protein